MAAKNRESLLWQKLKKGCPKIFFTRIESSTINGIPDIHAVTDSEVFWIELKSDEANYPKLNKWQIVWINKYIKAGGKVIILDETLSKRSLKLYRPVSAFTDPRSLKPRFSFSEPVHWPSFQDAIRELTGERSSRSRTLVGQSRFSDMVRDAGGSLTELDLARVT